MSKLHACSAPSLILELVRLRQASIIMASTISSHTPVNINAFSITVNFICRLTVSALQLDKNLYVCVCVCLSVFLSLCLSVCYTVTALILAVWVCMFVSVCLSIRLSVCHWPCIACMCVVCCRSFLCGWCCLVFVISCSSVKKTVVCSPLNCVILSAFHLHSEVLKHWVSKHKIIKDVHNDLLTDYAQSEVHRCLPADIIKHC